MVYNPTKSDEIDKDNVEGKISKIIKMHQGIQGRFRRLIVGRPRP